MNQTSLEACCWGAPPDRYVRVDNGPATLCGTGGTGGTTCGQRSTQSRCKPHRLVGMDRKKESYFCELY